MSMTTGFQRGSGHHSAQQFTSQKSRSAAFSSANPDVQIQQAAMLACLKIHRNTFMIFHVFLCNSFMTNFGQESCIQPYSTHAFEAPHISATCAAYHM